MNPLAELAVILSLGATAQLVAARLRIPSLLPLLAVGVLVGPVAGILDVPRLFGRMLAPFVSLAVALLLFEGGLTLRLAELRGTGRVVRNLVSIGALVTWLVVALATHYIAGLPADLAALTGAILALTGPTVVIPMLQHIRPAGPTGPLLRWEGILIDPIGAMLALLVFEVIRAPDDHGPIGIALMVLRMLLVGSTAGVGAGLLLACAIGRGLPERLLVPTTMAVVVAAFGLANLLQDEAGLLAVTVAGIVLANRRDVDVERIAQFKEDLGTVLLSMLFVVLAANLSREQLLALGWRHLVVVAIVIAVARPLAVLASTVGTQLAWRDRGFLMGLAPRGIVAAAVSSEFAMHLESTGRADAAILVPQVFATIAGTVLFYGLFAPRLATRLGLSRGRRDGVLFVGASPLPRALAERLHEHGVDCLLVDTNRDNISAALGRKLRSWHGSILSERFLEEVDLGGLGHVCAMTGSDEVNVLAIRRLQTLFGRANSYMLAPRARTGNRFAMHLHAPQLLFRDDANALALDLRLAAGAIHATRLTERFTYQDYLAHHEDRVLPLCAIDDGKPVFATANDPLRPLPGWTVLGLVDARQPVAATSDAATPSESSPPQC